MICSYKDKTPVIGSDSAGVLWGFGGRTELETAGADYIAGSFNDLLEILY